LKQGVPPKEPRSLNANRSLANTPALGSVGSKHRERNTDFFRTIIFWDITLRILVNA